MTVLRYRECKSLVLQLLAVGPVSEEKFGSLFRPTAKDPVAVVGQRIQLIRIEYLETRVLSTVSTETISSYRVNSYN